MQKEPIALEIQYILKKKISDADFEILRMKVENEIKHLTKLINNQKVKQ